MGQLDFYLIYKTKSNKWRVFADPAGTLILFDTLVSATDAGEALLSVKLATAYTILEVYSAHHVSQLTQNAPALAPGTDPS